MDTEDLRKFLVIAKHNNLQQASATLNVTPGALSKVIKRLEIKLNTQLFKRIGRNIKLNQQGEKFRHYALNLVHEADQAISEFNGSTKNTVVNLSGPSLLLQHYLPLLLSQFNRRIPRRTFPGYVAGNQNENHVGYRQLDLREQL